MVWACVGVLAVVGVLALAAVLRRRGGRGVDLVAGQLRVVADVRTTVPGSPDTGPRPPTGPARTPEMLGWDAVDEVTRRRVEGFVRAGARLSAINLVREAAKCSLAQAKEVVDVLGAAPRARPRRAASSPRMPQRRSR